MFTLDTEITQLSDADYVEAQRRLEDSSPEATVASGERLGGDLVAPF